MFLFACDPVEGGDTETDTDASADTWASFASAFSESYCVECHNSSPKDFSTYADFADASELTRCGVANTPQEGCGTWPPPMQFPIGNGPQPTADERDALVAWIDAGMPE